MKPDAFHHVTNPEVVENLQTAQVAVTPLRHPAEVWRAWAARGTPMEKFFGNWRLLDEYVYKYNIYTIPIDLPGVRDDELTKVSRALGRELETDWKPYGEFDGPVSKDDFDPPDLSEIMRYRVIKQFYPV